MSARRAGVPANLKKFKGQVRQEMKDALIEIRLKKTGVLFFYRSIQVDFGPVQK
jgi:hypothetical protein